MNHWGRAEAQASYVSVICHSEDNAPEGIKPNEMKIVAVKEFSRPEGGLFTW